jgi:membrane protease YdiL (CAAX protease family)
VFKPFHSVPLLVLATYILTSLSGFVTVEGGQYGTQIFFAVLILQIITFVLPGIFYCRLNGEDYIKRLNLRPFGVRSLLFVIPASLLMFLSSALIRLLGIYFSSGQYTPTVSVGGISPSDAIFILLVYCACPALCEEFVFRGIVLSSYRKYGIVCSVVVSAALFAMLHFSITDFFLYFVSGIILASVALITRSVFPCMIMHFLNNAFVIFFEDFLWQMIVRPKNIALFIFIIGALFLLLLFICLSHAEQIVYRYSSHIDEKENPPKREFALTARDFLISVLSPSFLMCVVYFAVASIIKL